MEIQQPKDSDYLNDFERKHMPFVKEPVEVKQGAEVTITVNLGELDHPTIPEHYIKWVALYNGEEEIEKKRVGAGGENQVEFTFKADKEMVPRLLAECSIHGIWDNTFDLKVK